MFTILVKCTTQDTNKIFNYIDDYGECLYIYIDLKKYDLEDENFNIWIQYNNQNDICALISEYYGGVQIYSKSYDLIPEEIANFIKKHEYSIIFGMKKTLDYVYKHLPEYKSEIGVISKLTTLKYHPNHNAYSAPIDELKDIVEIISEDENLGKPYGFEVLYNQYYERKENNFGRNFVLRDENNEIICHAGTNAELSELAIICGVITSPQYRGKGFSKGTLAALCEQLLNENKNIFSYYFIPSAEKMHIGVGFEKIGEWMKLKKID